MAAFASKKALRYLVAALEITLVFAIVFATGVTLGAYAAGFVLVFVGLFAAAIDEMLFGPDPSIGETCEP